MNKQSKVSELFHRAMDRVWARSNEDAERNPGGARFEADQRLLADARMAGWKEPAPRAARRAIG